LNYYSGGVVGNDNASVIKSLIQKIIIIFMKVTKGEIQKAQIELTVEISAEEFKPFIERGAEAISKEVKIEGFRPGKVPFDVLKQKVGEMAILEEASRLAVNKTLDQAMKEHLEGKDIMGQPQINITKLAPGNPLEFKVILTILPEVILPDLKNAKVKIKKVEIKPEEIETMISQLREMRVREVITDKEAKEGDKLIVDIQIYLDKVPVEGGQGKGTAVIIGKDYIVPGFDKQLIGMKKGEGKEFKLPYPENHYMKNLAGKLVELKVKVTDVFERELPEVNDEFASGFGLKHAQELKDNIAKSIEAERIQKEEQRAEIEMLEKLIKEAKYGDIPDSVISHEAESMIHELEHEVTHQGGKFEDYLQSLKKTKEQLMLEVTPEALKRVKISLLIREIAIKEKVTVSEKEIDDKVEELSKQYKGYEKVEERVKAKEYRYYLRNSIANKKVVDMLKGWNVTTN